MYNKKINFKMLFMSFNFKKLGLLLLNIFSVFILVLSLNFVLESVTRNFNMKIDCSPGHFGSVSPEFNDYLKKYNRKIKFLFSENNHYSTNLESTNSVPEQLYLNEFLKSVVATNSNFSRDNLDLISLLESILKYSFESGNEKIEFNINEKEIEIVNVDNLKFLQELKNNYGNYLIIMDETNEKHVKVMLVKLPKICSKFCSINDLNLNKISKRKAFCDYENVLMNALEQFDNENYLIKTALSVGHGEFDFSLKRDKFLNQLGVKFTKFNLKTDENLDEFDVLLISTPETDFDKNEITKIENFLNAGKSVIYCTHAAQEKLNLLEENFLKKFGIVCDDGLLVDLTRKNIDNPDEPAIMANLNSQKNSFIEKMCEKDAPLMFGSCKPLRVCNDLIQNGWKTEIVCKSPATCGVLTKENFKTYLDSSDDSWLNKSEFPLVICSEKNINGKQASLCVLSNPIMFGHLDGNEHDKKKLRLADEKNKNNYSNKKSFNSQFDDLFLSNKEFYFRLLKKLANKPNTTYFPTKKIPLLSSHNLFGEGILYDICRTNISFKNVYLIGVPAVFLIGFFIAILKKKRNQ